VTYTLAICAIAACALGLVATGLACRIAPRVGLLDRPDGVRKLHQVPVPLGGGVAVFAAFVVVLLAAGFVPLGSWRPGRGFWTILGRLLPAAAVIVALGLADDRRGLRGRQKLLGQLAAAATLVVGGLWIGNLRLFGLDIDLGLLALPFTLFWILGAVNAINLLDGLDGLAGTVGVILAGAVGLMAGLTGRGEVALVAFTFAGALVGFLRFNFPPARIFLGDAGSMLIGLVVGTLAVEASLKGPGTLLVAGPLAVWLVPALDTALAIVRRTLTGRSIYTTDRGHLHHRLLKRLGSNRMVLVVVGLLCSVSAAAGVSSVWFASDMVTVLTIGALLLVCIAGNVFGRAELALAARRAKRLAASLLPGSDGQQTWEDCLELQGAGPWRELWADLTRKVQLGSAHRMELTINLPAQGDCFHARWARAGGDEPHRCWSVQLPLLSDRQHVGQLSLSGPRNGQPAGDALAEATHLADFVEEQIAAYTQAALPAEVATAEVSEHTAAGPIDSPAPARPEPETPAGGQPLPGEALPRTRPR